MGVIGGGIFQAIKGFRNAPSVSINIVGFYYNNKNMYMGQANITLTKIIL